MKIVLLLINFIYAADGTLSFNQEKAKVLEAIRSGNFFEGVKSKEIKKKYFKALLMVHPDKLSFNPKEFGFDDENAPFISLKEQYKTAALVSEKASSVRKEGPPKDKPVPLGDYIEYSFPLLHEGVMRSIEKCSPISLADNLTTLEIKVTGELISIPMDTRFRDYIIQNELIPLILDSKCKTALKSRMLSWIIINKEIAEEYKELLNFFLNGKKEKTREVRSLLSLFDLLQEQKFYFKDEDDVSSQEECDEQSQSSSFLKQFIRLFKGPPKKFPSVDGNLLRK